MSDTVLESDAPTMAQKVAAEVLGTFVLVLFGVGAASISGGDYVATGLSFGLAVLVMAYAVGRVSGGHFNPAVSLGAAVGGRISWREAGIYMLSQLGGAILAGFTLWVLVHGFAGFESVGQPGPEHLRRRHGSGYAWWAALLIELVMTAIFVIVILAVTDVRNEHPSLAPMVIGLTLAVIHFASMAATGTSVNPARSIGPGLFAGGDAILQLWLFIVAPLLGALARRVGSTTSSSAAPTSRCSGSGLRLRRPAPQPAYPSDAYQQQWNQAYGQQQGYPQQQYPPAAAGQPQSWDGQPQTWEPQTWEGQAWEGQPAQPPQGQPQQPQSWEGQAWEGQSQSWPSQPPQSATQQPWTQDQNQPFPPAPTEPYWSQQLPENWNDTGEDEGGHTQVRPPERP